METGEKVGPRGRPAAPRPRRLPINSSSRIRCRGAAGRQPEPQLSPLSAVRTGERATCCRRLPPACFGVIVRHTAAEPGNTLLNSRSEAASPSGASCAVFSPRPVLSLTQTCSKLRNCLHYRSQMLRSARENRLNRLGSRRRPPERRKVLRDASYAPVTKNKRTCLGTPRPTG